MSRRAHIVEIAESWIGTPYLHQMSERGAGADCLGLVRGIWREFCGTEPAEVPNYTADWSEVRRKEELWLAAERHLDRKVPTAALPGDVLLFRMRSGSVAKHLGILARTDPHPSFIHAYSGHGVVASALTRPWARRVVACFSFPGV